MNKKNLKIGVDIDDVLIPFNLNFFNFLNDKLGTNLEIKDTTAPSLKDLIQKSNEEVKELLDEFAFSTGFNNLAPIDNSVEIIYNLKNNHCELYSITARSSYLEEITKTWLAKHFGDSFREVFHVGTSNNETEDEDRHFKKGNLAKELELDLFIEDNLKNAQSIAAEGIPVFLIDKPWNQSDSLGKNIYRVSDWREILAKIQTFPETN